MDKYEYKVIAYDTTGFFGGNVDTEELESRLDQLGNDGWEMVSSASTNQSYGSSKSLVFIFKRKKEQ